MKACGFLKKLFPSLLITILLLQVVASGHSGNTDANGGHYNRSTGQYHFHHGYPAHQHINGECPYNFDDQTGIHNGTPSSSKAKPSTRSSNTSPPAKSNSTTNSSSPFWASKPFQMATAFLCLFIFKNRLDASRKRKEEARKRAEEAEKFAKERQRLCILYAGKCLSELAPPPCPDDHIGSDGLPCGPGPGKWGENYTVYITSSKSKVFHRKQLCSTTRGLPSNIARVGNRRPCSKCWRGPIPDLNWYYNQRQILRVCQRYDIPLQNDIEEPNQLESYSN